MQVINDKSVLENNYKLLTDPARIVKVIEMYLEGGENKDKAMNIIDKRYNEIKNILNNIPEHLVNSEQHKTLKLHYDILTRLVEYNNLNSTVKEIREQLSTEQQKNKELTEKLAETKILLDRTKEHMIKNKEKIDNYDVLLKKYTELEQMNSRLNENYKIAEETIENQTKIIGTLEQDMQKLRKDGMEDIRQFYEDCFDKRLKEIEKEHGVQIADKDKELEKNKNYILIIE